MFWRKKQRIPGSNNLHTQFELALGPKASDCAVVVESIKSQCSINVTTEDLACTEHSDRLDIFRGSNCSCSHLGYSNKLCKINELCQPEEPPLMSVG